MSSSFKEIEDEVITTVEYMSEWDHGMEPNPLDLSYSKNDDDDEDQDNNNNKKGHHHQDDNINTIIMDTPKRLAKKVVMVATKCIHTMSDTFDEIGEFAAASFAFTG